MEREACRELVVEVFADILEVEVSRISEKTTNKNLSKWDSLNHVKLVVALEEEFDVEFDPEEMGSMTSVTEILNVLVRKTNS